MNQREEKVDDYSSDEEKRTASEKSLALDAVDPERSRGVLGMERLSVRIGTNRIYLYLLYGGFALLGTTASLFFFSDFFFISPTFSTDTFLDSLHPLAGSVYIGNVSDHRDVR